MKRTVRTKSIDLTLVLPCYNEGQIFLSSMERITDTLQSARLSWEIIFVDDGSTDGTRQLLKTYVRTHPQSRVLFHTKNTGRGGAVTNGIRLARGKVVGYIDIDCEVSPVYIPQCVAFIQRGQTDIVIGNRIYRSSLSGAFREAVSVGYRSIANRLIGTDGFDTESGYKFFDRKRIIPVLSTIHDKGWFWDTEVVVRSIRAGLRVMHVPVLFLRRTDKRSSVRVVQDTVAYLQNLIRFRRELLFG